MRLKVRPATVQVAAGALPACIAWADMTERLGFGGSGSSQGSASGRTEMRGSTMGTATPTFRTDAECRAWLNERTGQRPNRQPATIQGRADGSEITSADTDPCTRHPIS